ncbi:hypothetical protein AB0M28_26595 [Streptomyces sp. NPDC051940]|uniref:hypothetical protein n=1 Tax=Streptomyces sp. NPDC051940 TaxID=3155675 RepID=UPI0034297ABB
MSTEADRVSAEGRDAPEQPAGPATPEQPFTPPPSAPLPQPEAPQPQAVQPQPPAAHPQALAAQPQALAAHPQAVQPQPQALHPQAIQPPPPQSFGLASVPPPRRPRGRAAAAAVCLALALAALGGAVAGSFADRGPDVPADVAAFNRIRELWHSEPVDTLFPPTLKGRGAGPGRSDRTWTRIAVAPDSGCTGAFDPLLAKALAPAGCARLLRATYTDATSTNVITVGLVFASAQPAGMRAVAERFERDDLASQPGFLPRPLAAANTPAAGFRDGQRASWTIEVLPDGPVVVYAVSGFADGRKISRPEPADKAMEPKRTSAVAQSGLGHEALGVADAVETRLRARIAAASPKDDR